jgi:hypothetical protein
MIIIDPRTGREYDSEQLEARVLEASKILRDEREIKPRQFKMSDIDPENLHNGILVNSGGDITEQVKECNGKILWGHPKYAEGSKAGYDAIFKNVVPSQRQLIHQTALLFNGESYSETIIQNRTIGNPSAEIFGRLKRVRGRPTYLKVEGTDDSDYLGGSSQVSVKRDANLSKVWAHWNFQISVPELLKTRTIFFDPEGTYTNFEYKKIYLLFGGIPIQAITGAKIEIMQARG